MADYAVRAQEELAEFDLARNRSIAAMRANDGIGESTADDDAAGHVAKALTYGLLAVAQEISKLDLPAHYNPGE